MKKLFVYIIIFCFTLACTRFMMQSCSTTQAYGGNMDFTAVQTVLRDLVEQNKNVIAKAAPFIYEEDSFTGAKKSLGENRWVLGSWILNGSPDALRATVQKRYGKVVVGGKWEADVLDVSLKLQRNKYIIVDWRAYRKWGEYIR
jgi:hypothetical protein